MPGILTLEVEKKGRHTIHVSMREDGIAIDRILLVHRKDYQPDGMGPESVVKKGKLPEAFPMVAAAVVADSPAKPKPYPASWGHPPEIQTRDYVPLPGGYGMGSSTLAQWIQKNLDNDAKKSKDADGNSSSSAETPKPAQPVGPPLVQPRQPDASGAVSVTGELRLWHAITLTLDGPYAHEQDNDPNPFTDYSMSVTLEHESKEVRYRVPGYFAADGRASESGAESGTKWRAHFAPDRPGRWLYTIHMKRGKHAALGESGQSVAPYDGAIGRLFVEPSTKSGRDFRAHGRLDYVGKNHLQFAGTKQYFLKIGADSPETMFAYSDFDNTTGGKLDKSPLKTWAPHVADWRPQDPTWKEGKGKGLIGAINYLSEQGVNGISFLTYNAGGDGDNIWPFVERTAKLHYDCSKLDQWNIVLGHASNRGLFLHFKLQENELDDNRKGLGDKVVPIPESLDDGRLGIERKLYCREIIARFSHHLALNWNIGEENTQSSEEIRDMVQYLHESDPYHHPIVIHTYPDQQDKVYRPLLGDGSLLSGVSLQNPWDIVHRRTLQWLAESKAAGKPWVVANDEQNSAAFGTPPDPGYANFEGTVTDKGKKYTLHDIRKFALWGNLMAGGAGVEYYFGYKLPQNDLNCEDFRSRHQTWNFGRIALDFFHSQQVPFWEMVSSDALIGNDKSDNSKYCLAKTGSVYLIYLPSGGTTEVDLSGDPAARTIRWFNPRAGGALQEGSVQQVTGGGKVAIGNPPSDPELDWVVLLR